jgi:hypothetical protein
VLVIEGTSLIGEYEQQKKWGYSDCAYWNLWEKEAASTCERLFQNKGLVLREIPVRGSFKVCHNGLFMSQDQHSSFPV